MKVDYPAEPKPTEAVVGDLICSGLALVLNAQQGMLMHAVCWGSSCASC